MFSKIWVKAQLFPSVMLLVVAVASARGNTGVTERSQNYSCCKPTLKFNQQRENIWIISQTPIAYFKGSEQHCIHPCKKIEGGVMTLDVCVDVNSTIVWTTNMTEEERIYFSAQPCRGSLSKTAPGNQGCVGLLLLAVAVGGLFVKQMIC